MDHDISVCLEQLAARAKELGEVNTAIVLYSLLGQRAMNCDYYLATEAKKQAFVLLDQMNKPKT